MKTMLVTGGTDGIGKALVLRYLQKDYEIVAVGSSSEKGESLIEAAEKLGKKERITFIQANLSLVSENRRIIEMIQQKWTKLDLLVLCAANLKPQAAYKETGEGFEFTFALYYLSRYILSYELMGMLRASDSPKIINVAAPGMKGEVNWNDIQFKEKYDGQKVQFHGSRLNDLLGVCFNKKNTDNRIQYILFNPMAARTNGAKKMASGIMGVFMSLYYKFVGKNPEEIAEIIESHIEKDTEDGIQAYVLKKSVDMKMNTFNVENAKKLDEITRDILTK